MIKELDECADACLDAHKASLQTLRYCLSRGGAHADTLLLLQLVDCAQLSEACAELCIDDSTHSVPMAEACARACERAALACEPFDDVEMRQGGEVMRYCAQACYRVVHAVPA